MLLIHIMEQTELKYWVGLSSWKGIGWKKLEILLKHFRSIKKIWEQGPQLNSLWQNTKNLNEEMENLHKRLIKVMTIADPDYPPLLKETASPPLVLYILGSRELLSQSALAVVGTRRATGYGQRVTQRLVRELAAKLVIVSGLARGIDTNAHRTALAGGGKTIAVLGHGLDQLYPPENRPLAEEIVAKGGALVTEYPLRWPLDKTNFPLRNRIIAGLTLGTLVVEGGQKSGTKITANFAADFNREVFCVPGQIDSPESDATAELIKTGAKLITKAEDIWEEFAL